MKKTWKCVLFTSTRFNNLLQTDKNNKKNNKYKTYNTKCTFCNNVKDFVENYNVNNKDKIKYIEKIPNTTGIFFNKEKICTTEIVD